MLSTVALTTGRAFAVPPYYNLRQRRGIRAACQYAGWECLRIVDEVRSNCFSPTEKEEEIGEVFLFRML
jgi:molecular chaperone DnaK (HSP70)